MKSSFLPCLIVLVVFASHSAVMAETRTWTANNYSWHYAPSWSPEGYAVSDELIVPSGLTYSYEDVITDGGGSITFEDPQAPALFGESLYVGLESTGMLSGVNAIISKNTYIGAETGSFGVAEFEGATSALICNELRVGQAGTGMLHAGNGTSIACQTTSIGVDATGYGQVILLGDGTMLNTAESLIVGEGGTGVMLIQDGAVVSTKTSLIGGEDGNGTVHISGTGSKWLTSESMSLGYESRCNATMIITEGGQVISSGDTYLLAEGAIDGIATVVIDGESSNWTVGGRLTSASWAMGDTTIAISNGGSVYAEGCYIGTIRGRADVIVDGEGSRLNAVIISVGNSFSQNRSNLTVSNGATTNCAGLSIGKNGTVTIEGQGSSLTSSYFSMQDEARLEVWDGASFSSDIAYMVSETRILIGQDSSWDISEKLNVYSSTAIIDIRPGGIVTAEEVNSRSGALRIGVGEIGCGVMDINGSADLGGNLVVSLTDQYTPSPGDGFEFMTFGSLEEGFSELIGMDNVGGNAGLWFDLVYDEHSATLVTRAAPGDFDLDGNIDGYDFGLWQAGFGMTDGAAWIDGDGDGDGDVDGEDFGLWQSSYAPGQNVPEPATLSMLAAGLAIAVKRRRR